MDILAALGREETKFQKQVGAAQQQLDAVREAIKLLSGGRNLRSKSVATAGKAKGKKRVISAAGKKAISKATKARWAKWRAEKKGKS
jgi:NACalpha-BTF3-like transcription factor